MPKPGASTKSPLTPAPGQMEPAELAVHHQMRLLMARISDASYALDRDWRFTYLNNAAECILGQLRKVFPLAVETPLHAAFHWARAEGRSATVEFYYPPFTGWYEIRAHSSPNGLSINFRDVTERKRLEDETHALKAKYRNLDEHLPAIVYVLAADENQTALLQSKY